VNETENQSGQPEDLHPRVLEDIEAALEAAGDLIPGESSTAWALGVAVSELFNDVWRNAVESAPTGSHVGDIRRGADQITHEAIALAVAFLTMHDPDIQEYIANLEGSDHTEVHSHALWLREYIERLK